MTIKTCPSLPIPRVAKGCLLEVNLSRLNLPSDAYPDTPEKTLPEIEKAWYAKDFTKLMLIINSNIEHVCYF